MVLEEVGSLFSIKTINDPIIGAVLNFLLRVVSVAMDSVMSLMLICALFWNKTLRETIIKAPRECNHHSGPRA